MVADEWVTDLVSIKVGTGEENTENQYRGVDVRGSALVVAECGRILLSREPRKTTFVKRNLTGVSRFISSKIMQQLLFPDRDSPRSPERNTVVVQFEPKAKCDLRRRRKLFSLFRL